MTELESELAYGLYLTEDFKQARVVIHFRPAREWLGKNYGFDWIREVDYSLVSRNARGDAKRYEDTISKQYREPFKPNPKPESEKTDAEKKYEAAMLKRDEKNTYRTTIDGKLYLLEEYVNAYRGKFVNDPMQYRQLELLYDAQNFNDVEFTRYYCPWMSIYPDPDKKVKLSLVAKALDDEIPDSYELEYNTEFFDITLDKEGDLKSLTKGEKKGVSDAITFTCKKEFNRDQTISIYSIKDGVRQLAGKMYVWSNEEAKRKKANVVSVVVQTKPSPPGSSTSSTASVNTVKELNAQYLRQALIELKDEVVIKLNLSNDRHFQPKDAAGNGGHYYRSRGIVGYYTSTSRYSHEKGRHVYDGEPEGYLKLGGYLYEKLKEQLKAQGLDENKYKNYTRVYYLDQAVSNTNGTTYYDLAGYSEVDNKAVVIGAGASARVVAHEILHALNLMHSFNNKEHHPANKFCFESMTTDNIMDYSDQTSPKIPMNCLWKYQWEVANKSVMPDGSIKSKKQLQDEHIISPK